jgi:hypothetical protein
VRSGLSLQPTSRLTLRRRWPQASACQVAAGRDRSTLIDGASSLWQPPSGGFPGAQTRPRLGQLPSASSHVNPFCCRVSRPRYHDQH